ncbi:MAG: SUMF1/EgtB/PvdO family nonheme iron enzyme [Planctomycetota bacterium]|nr:SUMF1/EgtB/PvdO family nonheme iron enzyme [Planctomycetota bacterium]
MDLDWLGTDKKDPALPALRNPFGSDQSDQGDQERSLADGPFALPPLARDAADTEQVAADATPEVSEGEAHADTSKDAETAFSLEQSAGQAEAGGSLFALPSRTAGASTDSGLIPNWHHKPKAPQAPTEPSALTPLHFTIGESEADEAKQGFSLDPHSDNPLSNPAFLSRSEQGLRHGGFAPKGQGGSGRFKPAKPSSPSKPTTGSPDSQRAGISESPTDRVERDDLAASGISEAPTDRITRDPNSSGISEAPTTRHGRDDEWDASKTAITPAPGASDDNWDASKTAITPAAAHATSSDDDWDIDKTAIAPSKKPMADDWDVEKTALGPNPSVTRFIPEGAKPRSSSDSHPAPKVSGNDDSVTRATLVPGRHTPPTLFTTNKPTRSSNVTDGTGPGSGGTSTQLDAAWHLEGRKGPSTGMVWGDYEIGGIVGEGGMGLVYRARQKSLGRRCAVKVLSAHLANNPQLLERFELEARAAGTMRSHNVVAVYAAGNVEGQPYYVMEYVEGTDLDHVLKAKKAADEGFTIDEAIDITLQSARGLVEANSHNIVHRDIKPPNLMVTKKREIKITDFGIVKIQGEAGLTLTGQAMGTPAYISPEQGRGGEVDARSDLYSLGVVFYQLLTMQRPFDGNSADALIYQHSYAEPKLPRELREDIPEDVQAVCIKLLSKKPENRYQSAKDLVRDLEDFADGKRLEALLQQKLSTGGAEALRENQSWIQRNAVRLGAAAVLVTFLIAGSVVVWQSHENRIIEQQRKAIADRELAANNARERATPLYTELLKLNDAAPLVRNARNRITELRTIYTDYPELVTGDEIEQLQLWDAKLDHVAELRAELSPTESFEQDNWTFATLTAADAALKELARNVGTNPDDYNTWRGLVNTEFARKDRLRTTLDQATANSDAWYEISVKTLEDKLKPAMAELGLLLQDPEAELAAYQEFFKLHAEELAKLTKNLDDSVDRNKASDTAAMLDARDEDLRRAAKLFDVTSVRYVAWRGALLADIQALNDNRETGKELANRDLYRHVSIKRLAALHQIMDRLRDLEALNPKQTALYQATLNRADQHWENVTELDQRYRAQLEDIFEHPKPITGTALDQLAEIERAYGADNIPPHIDEWRKKADRVAAQEQELNEVIGQRFFIANLDEAFLKLKLLQAEVGPTAPKVMAWARQLDLLYGPGTPDWADEYGRDQLGIHATLRMPGDTAQRFRFVPAGRFVMGSPIGEDGRGKDETQTDVVVPKAFWLAETELTQEIWIATMGDNPSRHSSRTKSLQRPVNRVNMGDIEAFLSTTKDLAPLRLPGEHEWEYACRAGIDPGHAFTYNGMVEDLTDARSLRSVSDLAWFEDNSSNYDHPVAGKLANPIGLYDMHGNVWEWCGTPYGSYQILLADNFRLRSTDSHAARGGGWGDPAESLRAGNRLAADRDLRSAYLGLRLAADVDWQLDPDGSRILDAATPPTSRSDATLVNDEDNQALMESLQAIVDDAAQTTSPEGAANTSAPAAIEPGLMPNENSAEPAETTEPAIPAPIDDPNQHDADTEPEAIETDQPVAPAPHIEDRGEPEPAAATPAGEETPDGPQ